MKSCSNCKYNNGCGGACPAERCKGYEAKTNKINIGDKVRVINPDFSDFYNIVGEVDQIDGRYYRVKSVNFRGGRYYGEFYKIDLEKVND
jgi:hypothetical protein